MFFDFTFFLCIRLNDGRLLYHLSSPTYRHADRRSLFAVFTHVKTSLTLIPFLYIVIIIFVLVYTEFDTDLDGKLTPCEKMLGLRYRVIVCRTTCASNQSSITAEPTKEKSKSCLWPSEKERHLIESTHLESKKYFVKSIVNVPHIIDKYTFFHQGSYYSTS